MGTASISSAVTTTTSLATPSASVNCWRPADCGVPMSLLKITPTFSTVSPMSSKTVANTLMLAPVTGIVLGAVVTRMSCTNPPTSISMMSLIGPSVPTVSATTSKNPSGTAAASKAVSLRPFFASPVASVVTAPAFGLPFSSIRVPAVEENVTRASGTALLRSSLTTAERSIVPPSLEIRSVLELSTIKIGWEPIWMSIGTGVAAPELTSTVAVPTLPSPRSLDSAMPRSLVVAIRGEMVPRLVAKLISVPSLTAEPSDLRAMTVMSATPSTAMRVGLALTESPDSAGATGVGLSHARAASREIEIRAQAFRPVMRMKGESIVRQTGR